MIKNNGSLFAISIKIRTTNFILSSFQPYPETEALPSTKTNTPFI